MEQQLVDSKIKENVEMMNRLLPVKESFDIVERNMLIGGRKSCLYFINGFTNDESEQKIIDFFLFLDSWLGKYGTLEEIRDLINTINR